MLRHRFIVPQSYKSEERSKEYPISPAKPNQADSEPTGVLCYRILTNDCMEEDHSFLISERERESRPFHHNQQMWREKLREIIVTNPVEKTEC